MITPRRVVTLVLAASLAATAAGGQEPTRDLYEQLVPPELVLAHAEEIGLSPAQRQAVERVRAELGPRMFPLLEQMRKETAALVELLKQEKPDEAAMLAQFEKLSSVETDLKRLRLLMTARTKRVLTAEQQAKALAIQGKRLASDASGANRYTVRAKLQRVKDALEQWMREGRDVTPLREQWDRFREAEARGFYRQAREALDEAIALLEKPSPPKSGPSKSGPPKSEN